MNTVLSRSPLQIWLLLDSRAIGGIETHVGLLAEGLRDAGHRPTVVFLTDHGPHPLRDRLDALDLPWQVLGGGFGGLVDSLRTLRPDLVHTHGYKAGILARLGARVPGIPVVSSFHAGEPGAGWVRAYGLLDRRMAWLSHNIAVSRPILETLPSGAALVENFVRLPPEDLCPAVRPLSVAFVGRLSHEKGPDLFCRLAADGPADRRFEVFGDGPMRAELEAGYGARIVFHGNVPDMAARWSSVGLLCMPSRHEGLPMAALEAMARGVPVAGFGVGDLPRLIDDGSNGGARTGWIVPPGDLAALGAAVAGWAGLDDAGRRAVGGAARAHVARHHGLDAGVERVLEVYGAALVRGSRHSGAIP